MFRGTLTDDDGERVAEYFYDLPSTASRRNRYIYPSAKTGDLRVLNIGELLAKARFPGGEGAFVYPREYPLVWSGHDGANRK